MDEQPHARAVQKVWWTCRDCDWAGSVEYRGRRPDRPWDKIRGHRTETGHGIDIEVGEYVRYKYRYPEAEPQWMGL